MRKLKGKKGSNYRKQKWFKTVTSFPGWWDLVHVRFTWEQSAILAVWTEWWQGVSHVARVYLNLWLGRERRSIYEILDPDWLEFGLSVFKSKDIWISFGSYYYFLILIWSPIFFLSVTYPLWFLCFFAPRLVRFWISSGF